LRYGQAAAFTTTQRARCKALFHIGKLLGYSDESMLGNADVDSLVTSNPAFQQYLVVAIEGGSSATQVQNVWVKITYYVRMEVPIAVLDTATVRYQRHLMLSASSCAPVTLQALAPAPPKVDGTTELADLVRAAQRQLAKVSAVAQEGPSASRPVGAAGK